MKSYDDNCRRITSALRISVKTSHCLDKPIPCSASVHGIAGFRLFPFRSSSGVPMSRPTPNLTPRQRQIAVLLIPTGYSYKEAASKLKISEGTMRKHAENVYRKLGVHSRPELTARLARGKQVSNTQSFVHETILW
jgi:DNA-binding CsgD family transcriptional regulator